ncbi:hypothetical protein PCANC_14904 [Puccinia coronata f. sp. avenae]|uniref:Uncharacterized protein n=1 Tax=Puccinia coronata f. sp. avenae TaxID=200324 RepID=A0A2N5UKI2_9BASI|nr:hypothetical protein PCANC_14904 [Puccinia coronata f. sp. avenae]
MPSHLRNGKDLLFEQRRAAKRAAARDAGRIRQQQRLADLASRSGAPELPLSASLRGYHKLPGADGPASSVGQSGATSGLSAPGNAQPTGYTLSPAALVRLRRVREQQSTVDGLRGSQPAQNGSGLSPRSWDIPFREPIKSNVGCAGIQQIHPSTTPGGEVGLRSLKERSAESPDGRLYDADTDSPLSPHERSAQGQRNVHRPVTLHSSSPTGPRDFSRRRDASPRQVDPLGSTRQPRPVSPRRLEPSATSLQTRHIGRRETSLHVPGAYGSPKTSCASGASTATPSSVAAVAASAATTSATRASHNGSSHSPQLPARPGDRHCSSSERPERNKTAIAPSNYGCGESSFRVPASYASPQHSCPSGNAIVAPATGMAATNANCSFVEEAVALPGSTLLPTKG